MSYFNVMEDFGTSSCIWSRTRKYFIIQFCQNLSQHNQILCHVTSLPTHRLALQTRRSIILSFDILPPYKQVSSQVVFCWVFIKELSFIYVRLVVHIHVILPVVPHFPLITIPKFPLLLSPHTVLCHLLNQSVQL